MEHNHFGAFPLDHILTYENMKGTREGAAAGVNSPKGLTEIAGYENPSLSVLPFSLLA